MEELSQTIQINVKKIVQEVFTNNMKFLFTNVIGSFIVDEQGKLIDAITAETDDEKKNDEILIKKYKPLAPLPKEKFPQILTILRDRKYHSLFYKQNLSLTKKALRESVSEDSLITQAIANISELDKVTNLLAKRFREWYSLYFPEVVNNISSHEKLLEIVSEKKREELMKQFLTTETMGGELQSNDIEEMLLLAQQIKQLYQLRNQHENYLTTIMKRYCPNLLELAGVAIGAKLIELGKGLRHLAVLPASTIQLLGAEKALFRHIKTGSKSPKYGLLFQHPLVQNAPAKKRGKAARALADKLSLCARLDYFKGEFNAPSYKKDLGEKFA